VYMLIQKDMDAYLHLKYIHENLFRYSFYFIMPTLCKR
jgi:hypothetical protein